MRGELDRGPQLHGPIDVAAKRQRNVFFRKPQGKYNRVERALPFKGHLTDEDWVERRTPSGRRILIPKELA